MGSLWIPYGFLMGYLELLRDPYGSLLYKGYSYLWTQPLPRSLPDNNDHAKSLLREILGVPPRLFAAYFH